MEDGNPEGDQKTEVSATETRGPKETPVDIAALQDLQIGPDWSATNYTASEVGVSRSVGPRRNERRSRFQPREQGERRRRPIGRSHRTRTSHVPFKPVLDVNFYPDDDVFSALTKAIGASFRTYELFEVARLILEKPERFTVVVTPARDGAADTPAREFYVSVPDGLPFFAEDEALRHVLRNHLDAFFEISEIEVEPPKGVFRTVNRCTITGEVLGPTNYHRYAQLEQQHYATRLAHMPFDRFQERVETLDDAALIEKWLVKMTQQSRYRVLPKIARCARGIEVSEFDTLEGASHFMTTHFRDQVIQAGALARFSGKAMLMLAAEHPVRRSVEIAQGLQQRFPLQMANHLRGRFRRLNFAVYKRGSKSISFVSRVKRRFRDADQVFAKDVQRLIGLIEQNSHIKVVDLPGKFFENGGKDELAVESPGEPATGGEGVADASVSNIDPERLRALRLNLKWLITEGYVTEYSDGRLHASPPQPVRKNPTEEKPERHQPDSHRGEALDETSGVETPPPVSGEPSF